MVLSGGIISRTKLCVAVLASLMLCVPVAARVRGISISSSPARGRIAAGTSHTCAIASDDVVWCWGDNTYGQLGSNAHATLPSGQANSPVQAAALPGGRVARQITAGDRHVCVLANDGTVWCWGDNGYGQVGVGGGNQFDPVQVSLSSTATLVAAGGNNTCALLSTGSLMCWGKNNHGQLGNGTQDSVAHATPTAVTSIPSTFAVESIDIGALHACVTSTVGDTWCWGAFTNGRLGTTASSDSLTPQRISTLPAGAATSSAAGFNHSCVLVNTTAWCFGSNSFGQLGSDPNSYTESSTPLSVTFTATPDLIAVGKDFTCAVLVDQTAQCFGVNDNAQLGTSLATTDRYTPQTVGGLTSGVVDVALGATHACAVFTSGNVKCWGAGAQGQLGYGGASRQASAVLVGTLNIAPTTTTTTSSTTTSTSSSSTTSTSSTSTTVAPSAASGQLTVVSKPKYLTVKRNRYITARTIAKHVSLAIPKTSQGKMRFTIVRGSRYCTFAGTKVKGVRKGTCSVLVTLIPKRGPRTLRTAKVVVS